MALSERDKQRILQNVYAKYGVSMTSPISDTGMTVPTTPAGERGGILGDIVRTITSAPRNVINTLLNVGSASRAAFESLREDDPQKKQELIRRGFEELERERDFGFFGKGEVIDTPREAAGAGVEIGSLLGGGAPIRGLFGGGVRGFLRQTPRLMATEGLAGGLGSAGHVAQESDAGVGDIAGAGATGAALGAVAGPLTLGLTGGVIKGGQSIFRALRQTPDVVADSVGGVARGYSTKVTRAQTEIPKPKSVVKAVEAGIPERDANFISNMSHADKQVARNMLDLAIEGTQKFKVQRPVSLAGEAIMDRVKFVAEQEDKFGRQLGEIIRQMPPDPIDASDVYRAFLDDLTNAGIKIGRNGQLNFSGSRIGGTKGSANRKILQDIYDDIRPNKNGAVVVTPQKLHTSRQRVFDDLNLSKKDAQDLGFAETIANRYRKIAAQKLDTINNAYRETNQKFAQAREALEQFYGLLGKRWTGRVDDLAQLRAGEVGLRILGNASAVPLEVLQKLEFLAQALGYKSTNDVVDLLIFVDFLEDVFGTTQRRSLRGQVGRGMGDVAEAAGTAFDVVTGNTPGLIRKGINLLTRKKEITQEQIIEIIRALLD